MPSRIRLGRRLPILPALLALAANLIAAGGPVLHTVAHLGPHDEREHAELADVRAGVGHAHDDHGALHPASLDEDAPAVKSRGNAGFGLLPAAAAPAVFLAADARRDIPLPVPRLSSRAPPPGDPARAPPLA